MTHQRAGKIRALLLRLLAAGVLLWIVAMVVPWTDSLLVGNQRFTGEIFGDWKSEAVGFQFAPEQMVQPGSVLIGTPAASAVQFGGRIDVTRDSLETRTWTAAGESTDEPQVISAAYSWRPGMTRAFRELDPKGLVPAFALLILASLLATTRWWRILRRLDLPSTWGNALRLTYIGLFFNIVLPGLNGGDLARGVLVVRDHPEQRSVALVSVIVDRLIGLVAMITMALVVIFMNGDRLHELKLPVALVFGGIVLGMTVFLHSGLRRLIRFDSIIARLPQSERIEKVDRALRDVLSSPADLSLASVLSLGNHFAVTGAIMAIGYAFGDRLGLLDYLGVVTVSNTLSSLPIAPGGWGLGEASFGTLFSLLGAHATVGVATSVTYRLCAMALGLAGGVFLLLPGSRADSRVALEEVRHELADA